MIDFDTTLPFATALAKIGATFALSFSLSFSFEEEEIGFDALGLAVDEDVEGLEAVDGLVDEEEEEGGNLGLAVLVAVEVVGLEEAVGEGVGGEREEGFLVGEVD